MSIYLEVGVLLFIYFLFFFILSIIKKDNSLVDIAWGFGFVLAVLYTLFSEGISSIGLLVTVMVTIWGSRLGLHILARKVGKPEDFRYQKWRESWKYFYLRSFFQIYILQGILLYTIVFPAIRIIALNRIELGFLGYIGFIIWIIGFSFEVIGDWQLKKFLEKKEKKGSIMRSGLWKYTRHPNYFGEATMWWGIFFIAFSAGAGFYTVLSPIVITYLLLFVSGVPLLEEHFKDNPEFQRYAEKTNKFFPWFPQS